MSANHRVQNYSVELSVPYRAENLLGSLEKTQAQEERNQFLDGHNAERNEHQGETADKTNKDRNLRELVRNGVDHLAEIRDHIEMARYKAVGNIGKR